jgi:hypothetical protein
VKLATSPPLSHEAVLATIPAEWKENARLVEGYLMDQLGDSNPNFDRVAHEINQVGSKGGIGGGTPGLLPETRTKIINTLSQVNMPPQAGVRRLVFSADDETPDLHQANSNVFVWALHLLGMPLNETSSRKSLTDWFGKHLAKSI